MSPKLLSLLAEFEQECIDERCLSFLLAMHFWDLIETGSLSFWERLS